MKFPILYLVGFLISLMIGALIVDKDDIPGLIIVSLYWPVIVLTALFFSPFALVYWALEKAIEFRESRRMNNYDK